MRPGDWGYDVVPERWVSTEQVWGTGARLWAQEVCHSICWQEPRDAPWSPLPHPPGGSPDREGRAPPHGPHRHLVPG